MSGNRQVAPTTGKGTAVSNIYQSRAVDRSRTPVAVVPSEVLISLGKIVESAKEGLLASRSVRAGRCCRR
jgi:hypothetical protein